MSQVHKETLSAVDNALPNRAGLDIEIFGMEGIPEDIIQQHNQRVLTQYHQAEAERRVATGTTIGAGGVAAANQPKKPKFESPSDLKKRLAEHKAKLAAEQANGGSSGGDTPHGAGANQSPATVGLPQYIFDRGCSFKLQVASPHYPPQQHFNGPPGNASFNFPPGYGQPAHQGPPFPQPVGPFPQQSPFSPPPFPNQAPYPNSQFPPQMMQSSPPQFQGGSNVGPSVGPPRPFGAGSPIQQFGYQQQLPPRINTPPQRSLSDSLPPAPSLPQRPAFGVPHVNHFQMQQMHQGQIPGPSNLPINQQPPGSTLLPNNFPLQSNVTMQNSQQPGSKENAVGNLMTETSRHTQEPPALRPATETLQVSDNPPEKPAEAIPEKAIGKPADEPSEEKKDKKDKSKASHLVYSDQDTSPEEKMAKLARYAFTPQIAT